MHWLAHFFGLDNGSGTAYLFWSGIGSDIGEFAIFAGLVSVYRQHNCEVAGCWRLGRHKVETTGHRVCRRHHPDGAPTHANLLHMHHGRRDV